MTDPRPLAKELRRLEAECVHAGPPSESMESALAVEAARLAFLLEHRTDFATALDQLAELRAAVSEAGFRVAKNLAHPFLGQTPEDRLHLWCVECGRDSGFHWPHCSKSGRHD